MTHLNKFYIQLYSSLKVERLNYPYMKNNDDLVAVYDIPKYYDQFPVTHMLELNGIPYIVHVNEVMGFPNIYSSENIYGRVLVHKENYERAREIIENMQD